MQVVCILPHGRIAVAIVIELPFHRRRRNGTPHHHPGYDENGRHVSPQGTKESQNAPDETATHSPNDYALSSCSGIGLAKKAHSDLNLETGPFMNLFRWINRPAK
jgi:hypothetical protein